jgi:mRNA interferase MazF
VNRGARPIRRGNIYLVDFGVPRGSEQAGIRPAVVVSTDDLNEVSSTLIVAAITKKLPSADRARPQHVPISITGTGLTLPGMIKVDQIITVSRDRLQPMDGDPRLSPALLEQLDESLFYVLGLDDEPETEPDP